MLEMRNLMGCAVLAPALVVGLLAPTAVMATHLVIRDSA